MTTTPRMHLIVRICGDVHPVTDSLTRDDYIPVAGRCTLHANFVTDEQRAAARARGTIRSRAYWEALTADLEATR